MDEIQLWVALTAVSLALLLVFERGGSLLRRTVFKSVASTGFVLAAISCDAMDTWYGRIIFLGLVLSWCGDLLLLSRGEHTFQAGLVCFLLAHVAYVAAFAVAGIRLWVSIAVAIALVPVLVVVARWLMPKVAGKMRLPVGAYMAVISLMVTFAGGASWEHDQYVTFLAAILFWVSDLFVARDRFVAPGFLNSVCGLPLYYAAQLLFAYSATLIRDL